MTQEDRVKAMEERFRVIGEANVKGLPIYNELIAVEAVDFRELEDGRLLGCLITPWFINLMLLPAGPEPWNPGAVGRKATHALPSGEQVFTVGGDAEIGAYDSRSVKSPVNDLSDQETARTIALDAMERIMTPPPPESGQDAPCSRARA